MIAPIPYPCPVTSADWDLLPRLLNEICEGHGRYMEELYRLDYPAGGRTWLCRGCYLRAWVDAGRPPQHHRGCDTTTHRPDHLNDR